MYHHSRLVVDIWALRVQAMLLLGPFGLEGPRSACINNCVFPNPLRLHSGFRQFQEIVLLLVGRVHVQQAGTSLKASGGEISSGRLGGS